MCKCISLGVMFLMFLCVNTALAQDPAPQVLSDWSSVHTTIQASDGDDFIRSFSELHNLVYLTNNAVTPRCHFKLDWNASEKEKYSIWAKQQWLKWWEMTGSLIEQKRHQDAAPDQKSWARAIELTQSSAALEPAPKIWVPDEWTMYLYFKNGDYGGMEKEEWVIHFSSTDARMYRIKANVWNRRPVIFERCMNIDQAELAEFFAIVTYIFEYQLRNPTVVTGAGEGFDKGYYYPHGMVRLDGEGHSLWYLEGFEHHDLPNQYKLASSDYELNDQKPGLVRSIAISLWDKKKEWKRVFQLGSKGRQLIRDTLYEPVFDKIVGDQYRFAVLAASGDDRDAEIIERAIGHAKFVESEKATFQEMVTRNRFHTRENKWVLLGQKDIWQGILDGLRSSRNGIQAVEEDQLMTEVPTDSTSFQLLNFNSAADARMSNALSIPIGIK